MTRPSGFCHTCGAVKSHQRWHPHVMTDYSHDLVDDAKLSNMNPVDVFTCPSCGFVGCVVEYHNNGVGFWDLDTPCDCEPRYCPSCGKPFILEYNVEVTYTSKRRIEDMPKGWRGNHVEGDGHEAD